MKNRINSQTKVNVLTYILRIVVFSYTYQVLFQLQNVACLDPLLLRLMVPTPSPALRSRCDLKCLAN